MMRHCTPAAALAAALTAAPAFAEDAGVRIGTLTCEQVGDTVGVITGETQFHCVYEGINGEVTETYTGEISKLDLDLTKTDDATMVWAVVAPSASAYEANALSGAYVGASGPAPPELGASERVLVGGSDQAFTLQPVSVEGLDDTGISLGIQEFELRS